MDDCEIKFEDFSETDFEALISWVKDEKELIQFALPIFSFPLTKERLRSYLADIEQHPFKIIHNAINTTIQHCETYKMNDQNSRVATPGQTERKN